MCRKLTIWDTKFRVCEGKVWRFYKHYKIWKRCDDNRPSVNKYIQLILTNKEGIKKWFRLNRLIYKAYNPDWNIEDNSMDNFIDHKDGNKLNNRIDNLRVLSHQKNQWNTKANGCSYKTQRKKWSARIKLNQKEIHLGYYTTEDQARNVYLKIKKYLHNIEDKKFDKLTIEDLDYISTEQIKKRLLTLINKSTKDSSN